MQGCGILAGRVRRPRHGAEIVALESPSAKICPLARAGGRWKRKVVAGMAGEKDAPLERQLRCFAQHAAYTVTSDEHQKGPSWTTTSTMTMTPTPTDRRGWQCRCRRLAAASMPVAEPAAKPTAKPAAERKSQQNEALTAANFPRGGRCPPHPPPPDRGLQPRVAPRRAPTGCI